MTSVNVTQSPGSAISLFVLMCSLIFSIITSREGGVVG